MAWIISFIVSGDTFDPREVDVDFNESDHYRFNIASDIAPRGPNKGKPYGYGMASYTVPSKISRLKTFQHLADLFEPKLDELKSAGADEWYIDIGRLYQHQCNEELDTEELIQITRLKCHLSYSAYAVSEEELTVGWSNP